MGDYTNWIGCTNEKNVFIEQGDRRTVLVECSNETTWITNKQYFKDLTDSMGIRQNHEDLKIQEKFYGQLLNYFLNMDLSEFDPKEIPRTQAREDALIRSESQVEQFYKFN